MSFPDNIKIDDVTSGKVEPQLVYDELDRLKLEINILRSDMSRFLSALVTIPPSQHQLEYYNVIVLRLNTLKASIADYCLQYNKLLPLINLSQIRLGHEVEIFPPNMNNNNSPAIQATQGQQITSPDKNKKRATNVKGKPLMKPGSSGQPIVL